jgi:Helix-turn-helix domain
MNAEADLSTRLGQSLDDVIATRLEDVVRRVLEEQLQPLREQIALLATTPASGQNDEDELSLRQISEQYGYAPNTVRRWIRDGEIAAKKGPKEWRIRRADLRIKIGTSSGPASVVDIRSKVEKMLSTGRGRA